MAQLLAIKSSLFGDHGNSSQLVNEFISLWQAKHADAAVEVLDLAATPVPHLDAARVTALNTPAADLTAEQAAVVAYSDALIAQIQAADALVIGVPMYNFGFPTQLKAYFDHLARAGVTFTYGANGPEGLLNNKPVYLVASRGGEYAGTAADVQTPYLRTFLGFIGLTDLHFVYAEGLNKGAKDASFAAAKATLATLV